MKRAWTVIGIIAMTVILTFPTLPASAQANVKQGNFALELARALGLEAASADDAIVLLAGKDIVPGDYWVAEGDLTAAMIQDLTDDISKAHLDVSAVKTALSALGSTESEIAALLQAGTGQGGGQDLATVKVGGGGGQPQQQKRAVTSPFVP